MFTSKNKSKISSTSHENSYNIGIIIKKNEIKKFKTDNKKFNPIREITPKNKSIINNLANSGISSNIEPSSNMENEISKIYNNNNSTNNRPISVSRLKKNELVSKSYILNTYGNNNNIKPISKNDKKLPKKNNIVILTENGNSKNQGGQLVNSVKKSRNQFYKSLSKIHSKKNSNSKNNASPKNIKKKVTPQKSKFSNTYKNLLTSSTYALSVNNILSFSNNSNKNSKIIKSNKILNFSDNNLHKLNQKCMSVSDLNHLNNTNHNEQQSTNSNYHTKTKSNNLTNDTVYNTNYIINFIDDSKSSFKNIIPLSSNKDNKKNKNNQKDKKKEYAVIPISSNLLSRSSNNYCNFQIKRKKSPPNNKIIFNQYNSSDAKINSVKKKSTYNYFMRKDCNDAVNLNNSKKIDNFQEMEDIERPEEMHFYMNKIIHKSKDIERKYEKGK